LNTSNIMRAAVYRGENDVRVETVPVPEIGPGEALVKIEACGVCGTDLKKIQYGLVEPPRIFGHEMAGTIAAIGEDVSGWRVGDRVAVMHHVPCLDCYYCGHRDFAQCAIYKKTGTTAGFEPAGGGFARFIRVMDWVIERGMVRIPDESTFEEATFIEPLNTVLKAIDKSNPSPGDTALVVGQGQIGLLFNQVLSLRGVTVLGSDPLAWRREQGRCFGACASIDPAAEPLAGSMRDVTGGRGADLAVVAVANNGAIAGAMESVRPGGTVLLFAQTRLNDAVRVDAGTVCMLEKDLIGSYSSDIELQGQAADLIFSRKVDVRGLITDRFPLERIGEAFALASSPRDGSLKVMVQP
jgi:L-iditol 2-dehydrogenase